MCSGKGANPSSLFAATLVWWPLHSAELLPQRAQLLCTESSRGVCCVSVLQTGTGAEGNLPRTSLLWKCVPGCPQPAVPLAEHKVMFSEGSTAPEQTLHCNKAQISTDSKPATNVFSLKLFSPSGQIYGSQSRVPLSRAWRCSCGSSSTECSC